MKNMLVGFFQKLNERCRSSRSNDTGSLEALFCFLVTCLYRSLRLLKLLNTSEADIGLPSWPLLVSFVRQFCTYYQCLSWILSCFRSLGYLLRLTIFSYVLLKARYFVFVFVHYSRSFYNCPSFSSRLKRSDYMLFYAVATPFYTCVIVSETRRSYVQGLGVISQYDSLFFEGLLELFMLPPYVTMGCSCKLCCSSSQLEALMDYHYDNRFWFFLSFKSA